MTKIERVYNKLKKRLPKGYTSEIMKTLKLIIFILLITSQILTTKVKAEKVAYDYTKIYNKNYEIEYRIEDNKIYDKNWKRIGYIEENKVYNNMWKVIYRIER